MRKGSRHSPETIAKMRKPKLRIHREVRFWRKVNKNGPIPIHMPHLGECWEWTGARNKHYGTVYLNGRRVYAHRFAYELEYGPVPGGLCVCHACDFEFCVRPSHLFLGTKIENNRDRDCKGRQARGERSGTAKLTRELAERIRMLRHDVGLRIGLLADLYEISETTVGNVIHGRTWKAA